MTQQLGAALGLAVLVTVFGVVTKHAQLGGRLPAGAVARVHASIVHGIDDVFGVGLVFTVAALALIAGLVRSPRKPSVETAEVSLAGEAEEWLAESPLAEAS